ncbi:hypothetical protein B6U81_06015 [Thermoplasmatales archaeon ex4484_30]|nr:MAG: hypothetical protein B6U81_06015 [Thermoplasmatales archaeon ex4484_30]
MKRGAYTNKMILKNSSKICGECENWEKDPIPYNNIYFGVCKIDGKIKYEFHVCDFSKSFVL